MKYSSLFGFCLIACSTTGSVVVDPEGNIVEDTVEDTGMTDTEDSDDTDGENDTDNSDDTDDNNDTDNNTDTDEPVELPADNDNPNIYPNYWEGYRTLSYENCEETIVESGIEVSNDYPDWMAICDCDEIYYVETDRETACNFEIQTVFYRAIKYNGQEIEVRYYPGNPSTPSQSELLAVGQILADGNTWAYSYEVDYQGGSITLDGKLIFSE